MKITKIRIQNFRLLKNITIDVEDNLSLIIGRNNCGKTSVLLALDKFLNGSTGNKVFSFDDFNVDFKEELKSLIETSDTELKENIKLMISLKLFIEYDENDDLSNIGNKIIMDLDPDNRTIVLAFEYYITDTELSELKEDYKKQKTERKENPQDILSFLSERHSKYFKIAKKSVLFKKDEQAEDDENFVDLVKEHIKLDDIISFKVIGARRDVSNKDSNKTLSVLSSKIYNEIEPTDNDLVSELKDSLTKMDGQLNAVYDRIFQDIIEDIKKIGGMYEGDSRIKIESSLSDKNLLEHNTNVKYGLEGSNYSLPESYNGLGYMNLISMIFEIKILLREFERKKERKPADINLLFIEEPEAHTHPQMQSIFIRNIKSLLKNGSEIDGKKIYNLQTILSTHSSHIVSESDFDDIKYFKKNNNSIESKNLRSLKKSYETDGKYYKFLKQYLTISKADLFFADKAIFIEGQTERIILPAMMKKIDQQDFIDDFNSIRSASFPLLSQNVVIVEIANAHYEIFERFMDFIGIKTLIITDFDTVKSVSKKDKNGKLITIKEACPVIEGEETCNTTLKRFFGNDRKLSEYATLPINKKQFRKDIDTDTWINDDCGRVLCIYQTEENVNHKYHARSFEDAFLAINNEFIKNNSFNDDNTFIGNISFPSITQKTLKNFVEDKDDAWEAAKHIVSKPAFAMEILLNSEQEIMKLRNSATQQNVKLTVDFSNWVIPAYIKEGLTWLKQG